MQMRNSSIAVRVAVLLALAWTLTGAAAHTRWFTNLAFATDLPLPPGLLFATPVFMLLFGATMAVALFVDDVDARLAGHRGVLNGWLARVDRRMTRVAAPLLRLAMALYFACVAQFFGTAPIALTPELRVDAAWVLPVQVLIAGSLLFEAGTVAGCLGVLVLYVHAASVYGWIHLIDYHLFLGVCVFLVLHRMSRQRGAATGLLLLRLLVGTSFLWVGIEKWLYPQWTEDVMVHQLPVLLMGIRPGFFVMAAGFVEVALAFLLVFGGLSSQVAALVLLGLLAGAIPLAGTVDGIGHLPMLAALAILATTRSRLADRFGQGSAGRRHDLGATFVITVPGLVGLYFLSHQLAAAGPRTDAGGLVLPFLWSALLVAWAWRAIVPGPTARLALSGPP